MTRGYEDKFEVAHFTNLLEANRGSTLCFQWSVEAIDPS